MTTRESAENAFLQGNFGPGREEGDAPDLEVIGALPRDLNGTFYRNGPNPAFEPPGRYHWFDGDGMIHAIHLEDGRASYRNRWVQSRGLAEERAAGHALYPGIFDLQPGETPTYKNTANTNIVWHAGKLLALMEAGNGVGEPLFVPRRPDSAEDDGYVLALAYDEARHASDFYVLDARNISGEPIARVVLPHRVPYGFHGNWVPGA